MASKGANYGTGQHRRITAGDVRKDLAEARSKRVRILRRDGTCPGLFSLTGQRGGVWWYEFKPPGVRPDGKRHGSRYTRLGGVDVLSPDDARHAAAQAKHKLLLGVDLHEERRRAQQQARARATAASWVDVEHDYLRYLRRKLRLSSYQTEVSGLKRVFEILDPKTPLQDLGPREVAYLTDRLPAEGAVAVHAVSALGRLLDWAKSRSIVDANTANPVRLLPRGARPRRPAPRRRVPAATELGRLWRAAERLAPVERDLLRFTISTPLRRTEASLIEWSWLDRDANTITLPATVAKNKEAHVVPLGALARQVLDAIGGETCPRGVNPSPTTGRVFARIPSWYRFKQHIDKIVSLDATWVFHDFRRSFVTLLAERGHSEAVLDQLISHRQSATRSGVLGVYQRAKLLPAQRAAMADWDLIIKDAIGGDTDKGASAEVIPLRQRG
jgi:integrase